MIVSYSTYEDVGTGFRERLFRSLWIPIKARLSSLEGCSAIPPIDVRFVIKGDVEQGRRLIGIQGPSFVVQVGVPSLQFAQMSIAEKHAFLLREIFAAVISALEFLGAARERESVEGAFGMKEHESAGDNAKTGVRVPFP